MKKTAAAALLVLLTTTSCTAPASYSAPMSSTAPAPAPDEDYPSVPAVTWDPASEQSVKDTAARAMTFFARPRVDQRQWITDLAPLLAPDYRAEAEYINPARVPVSQIVAGPVLSRESGNPLTVRAAFTTNAGEWVVLLHRAGQTEPWLVQAINPKNA
jgi:hypothetical protein